MTERISRDEYRKEMGLLVATDPKPRRRDTRWRDELHRQLVMHPALRDYRMVVEYQFHETRQWRFDFCYPDQMLAIEVEGIVGGSDKSRHTTFTGYTNDCEKYSLAAVEGYRVIRCTQAQIKSGAAVEWVRRALEGK